MNDPYEVDLPESPATRTAREVRIRDKKRERLRIERNERDYWL